MSRGLEAPNEQGSSEGQCKSLQPRISGWRARCCHCNWPSGAATARYDESLDRGLLLRSSGICFSLKSRWRDSHLHARMEYPWRTKSEAKKMLDRGGDKRTEELLGNERREELQTLFDLRG